MAEKLLRNGIRHRLQLYSEIKITPDKRFLTKRKKSISKDHLKFHVTVSFIYLLLWEFQFNIKKIKVNIFQEHSTIQCIYILRDFLLNFDLFIYKYQSIFSQKKFSFRYDLDFLPRTKNINKLKYWV